MSKIYVPNLNDYSCVYMKDSNTLRAFKQSPNIVDYDNLYRKVDYILSTSKEMYIDTGLKFDKNYRIEVVGNTEVNSSAMFFDSYVNNTNRVGNIVYNKTNPRVDYWFNNVSYSTLSTDNIDLSKKFTLIQNNSSISIEQNSYRNVINYNANILDNGANILFFRSQRDLNYEYSKVYSIKIFLDNNIIRDFVPVYNINTNIGGLYDTINKKFYASNGTNQFVYEKNNVNEYEYVDYFVNSHYLYNNGIENTFTDVKCLENSVLTDNVYYRNDFTDILLLFVLLSFICFYLPTKLFFRLFKKKNLF